MLFCACFKTWVLPLAAIHALPFPILSLIFFLLIIWEACVISLVILVLIATFHWAWKILIFLPHQIPESLIAPLQDEWSNTNYCYSISGTKQIAVGVTRERILGLNCETWSHFLSYDSITHMPYMTISIMLAQIITSERNSISFLIELIYKN